MSATTTAPAMAAPQLDLLLEATAAGQRHGAMTIGELAQLVLDMHNREHEGAPLYCQPACQRAQDVLHA